jgi:hypothetical protein
VARQLEAADVVVVTEEGDADLVAKLSRFGANIDRVHVLNPDGGAGVPTFGELVSACGDLAARTGARLVLLDTFAAWGGLSGDEERSEGVVGPLVRMPPPLRPASCCAHHRIEPEADGGAAVQSGARRRGRVLPCSASPQGTLRAADHGCGRDGGAIPNDRAHDAAGRRRLLPRAVRTRSRDAKVEFPRPTGRC